jgi:hypothetical protein
MLAVIGTFVTLISPCDPVSIRIGNMLAVNATLAVCNVEVRVVAVVVVEVLLAVVFDVAAAAPPVAPMVGRVGLAVPVA